MAQPLVLLRNSERSTYRRCRQKWKWGYENRLSPLRRRGALAFGDLSHQALAIWYPPGTKRGPHPADTFIRLYEEAVREQGDFAQWDDEGNRIPALDLGVAMMTGYVEKYGKEPHLEILQPETTFQIDVYDKRGNYLVTMVGTMDAVYRNKLTGRVGMLEHKTGKSIEDVSIVSGYGEQGLTYWWAANMWFRHVGWLDPDALIDAVLFNWLRKALPDDRPKNAQGHALNKPSKEALVAKCVEVGVGSKGTIATLSENLRLAGIDAALLGEPSKRQSKPLFERQELILCDENLETINRRIRMEAWEMAQVKAGKLPVYKNPTKDCRWDCPFKDACEIHEMGGDFESVFELEFTTWDPYESHMDALQVGEAEDVG